jgi:shikimate kinase
MKIYIIGMPGTGKTHFGRMLAKSIRLQFIDLDELLEKKDGRFIRQIVKDEGEDYFRELERQALDSVSGIHNCIVSCGGGTPMYFDNLELMKRTGFVIWLNTNLDVIARRIMQNKTRRPLFMGLDEHEIRQKLDEIYEKRKKNYAKADMQVDNMHFSGALLGPVIQKIMKYSKSRGK